MINIPIGKYDQILFVFLSGIFLGVNISKARRSLLITIFVSNRFLALSMSFPCRCKRSVMYVLKTCFRQDDLLNRIVTIEKS